MESENLCVTTSPERSRSPLNQSRGESPISDISTPSRNSPCSTQVRGRARGRGRTRSRGRASRAQSDSSRGQNRGNRRARGGRGRRGRDTTNNRNRAEEAAALIAQREAELEERLQQISEDQLRSLVTRLCRKYPSFVLDVWNESTTSQIQGGYHPPPSSGFPSWCSCTFCREMPTEAERVCCRQVSMNCYSRVPDFGILVLDEAVLAMSQRYREDVLVFDADNDINRGFRHAAYRQFILWHYGRLGAGNRCVIPSCCVWKIRDKYPDPFSQYTGFKEGRLS